MKTDEPQSGVHQVLGTGKFSSELDPNRLGRIRGAGQGGKRRDGRRSGRRIKVRRARSRRRVAWRWTLVIGAVALLALGGVFASWLVVNQDRARDTTEDDRQAKVERVRRISTFDSPSEAEALAMVRKVLAIREPGEVDALIRRGPMSREEVVRALTALPTTDGPLLEETWLGGIDRNGLQLEGVELMFGDREHPKPRLVMFTPDERGVWRMDMPAFVRLVEPPWDRMLADPALTTAVVRVALVPDNYYNGPFASEDEWEAYGLVSQDTEELPVGYCRRGSPQFLTLRLAANRADGPAMRMTLQLRRVAGGDKRQFEISRVLAEDWVLGDEAADETIGGAERE